ncbi:MAG: hypothetical protein WA175_00380 [Candidatus Acidiferrales bacterium]
MPQFAAWTLLIFAAFGVSNSSMDFADVCSFWRQQQQHGLCRCLQLLASATAAWTLLMFAAFGVSNSSMDFAFLSWLKGPKMQFFCTFLSP